MGPTHDVTIRHWTAMMSRANHPKTRDIRVQIDGLGCLMGTIDPTARVEDGAVIGEGTSIGPYCIIGPNVIIGANCKLIAHVHVTAQTTIGDGCTIYPFASLGTPPQSLSYKGELTRLEIGEGCTIRESVTMNAGTVAGGGLTRVHQFTRVGPQVMVGGVCGVRGDVIPFGLVNGQYAALEGLNIIGMKRRNFTKARLAAVRAFYQKLFHGPGIFAERLDLVQPMAAEDPAIAEILAFIGDGKHRALCLPADDGNKH